MTTRERILVIRLGALGDLVLCFQAFHEIRRMHPDAEIALLTMPAFADFAKLMPWFDKVLIDERAPGSKIGQWIQLIKRVQKFKPTRVYDLQGKLRQNILYGFLGGPFGPEWSGAAPLCSHPRLWPPQKNMHYTDFVAAQLRLAKVPSQSSPDLAWLSASLDSFSLPEKYALLIPGCAPGREYKRWQPKNFASVAIRLRERKIGSVVIGTKTDAHAITALRTDAPHVVDLTNKTSLLQLGSLARQSTIVLGNDTGPTHLAAAVDAPTLALMSDRVNPVWSSPRGPRTEWLQGKPLDTLSIDEVFVALTHLIDKTNPPNKS